MVCVGGTLRCLVLIRWFALLITGLLLSTWYDDPPFVTLLIPSCYSLVLYGPVTLFLSTRGDTHTCVLCQTTSKAIREVVGVCFWKNIDIVCNGHRLLKWWIGAGQTRFWSAAISSISRQRNLIEFPGTMMYDESANGSFFSRQLSLPYLLLPACCYRYLLTCSLHLSLSIGLDTSSSSACCFPVCEKYTPHTYQKSELDW